MRYFKPAMAIMTAFSALMLSGTAHAGLVTSPELEADTAKVLANTNSTAATTQGTITTMQQVLAQAILQLSGQNTANSNAAMVAASNMAGVQDQREVMRRIEDAKFNAATNSTSGASVCNVITGAIKTQNLEALTAAWRTQAVQAQLAASRGFLNGKWAGGTQVVATVNNSHCATNATQADVTSGMCTAVSQAGDANSAGMSGTGTVVVPDDENGNIPLNNDVITGSQAKAMDGFLYLLENTEPPNPAQPGSYKKDSEGLRQSHIARAVSAQKSISSSILAGLIGQTQVINPPGDPNQAQALSWAEATADNVGGYAKSSGPYCSSGTCYFPNGISELAVDELRSKSWFYNANWGVRTGTAGPPEVEKDMAMMLAWQVVQNYKTYKVMREIDMSIAAMESMMAQQQAKNANR